MSFEAVLGELAAEVAAPICAGYAVGPDGRRVAVVEWVAYPPRPKFPVLLLGYGPFVYDATRCVIARLAPRAGRVAVYDTAGGGLLASWPGWVVGAPVWSQDGRFLAGLTPSDEGNGHGVWVLDVASGAHWVVPELLVSWSLLGAAGNHAEMGGSPLWWTCDGHLLVARESVDRSAIDPRDDIVAEPEWDDPPSPRPEGGEEPAYHHDLVAIGAAARVDLVVVDPGTAGVVSVLREGCVVADCQLEPGGDRVLVAVGDPPGDVADLLSEGTTRYEIHCPGGSEPIRPLGRWPVGAVRWQPGPRGDVMVAERGDEGMVFRSLADDAARGRIRIAAPVAAWLPTRSGGVLAVTEPLMSAAGADRDGGRQLLIADRAGSARVVRFLDDAQVRAARGPCRIRIVPTDGDSVVGVDGLGTPGERLIALAEDGRSEPPRCVPDADAAPGRVAFLTDRFTLIERREAGAWSLERRARGEHGMATTAVHRLAAPKPSHARRRAGETGGRLNPWTAYQVYDPPPAEAHSRSRPAVLVELCMVPPQSPLPEPTRPVDSTPPLTRAQLGSGNAVAGLYVRLPGGGSVSFADIRTRLTTAVSDLRAALATSGRVDVGRMALVGHSFGAACAGVVLAHSSGVFRCAILRAGAYNRTLTPRGFHDELRDLWHARDVYDGFTLAYHARNIDCPVLILQGSADANGVTDALQAWTFYDTLLAAGGHARLVLLYNEGHSFTTREGVLTAAREELTWMTRWTSPTTC
ncbi:S9 family peptidase [Nocardia pseudobrasiliensis]|uniref:Dipeptidyl aminopeptidase/acylaminoacyl peptidase n=1 Tax=Nocardia pseudobrasiliensis TaxID=45979 RepID=A0A370I240_9NOCA|nr:prolyl oligopeptidase family serine peptidase [Nocardia pseudobrasiliensis]RDI64799.1 dipeptidyl aminopeptidase/acylaminoacyl peptidase [Nocardia pseudobrasiliensis]